MNTVSRRLGMAVLTAAVLYCIPAASQLSPTTKKTTAVNITEGPELELARPNWAIVTWTCDNPGGSPEHYGIVHYGTDAKNLNETAKSPIRVNPNHSSTVFRVRIEGLQPRTTYYYTVASMGANGEPDAVQQSPVKQFSTQ
jgi:Tfp pilus assembly protein PilX